MKLLSDKSLNSTIENCIEQFLPNTLIKYQPKNLKLIPYYEQISKEIPIFLHLRPEAFIRHIVGD